MVILDAKPSREVCLRLAWEEFIKQDKADAQKALHYAQRGKLYLDRRWRKVMPKTYPWKENRLYEIGLGYHIIAMVFVWNNLFAEAYAFDQRFMRDKHLDMLFKGTQWYLELLIAKGQEHRLEFLFSNPRFKKYYLHHYEVYVSFFINDKYPHTSGTHQVLIINRVNAMKDIYRI